MAKVRIPESVKVGLDQDKANAELEHKYVLNIRANKAKDLAEEDKVYVICQYPQLGEMETLYSELEKEGNTVGYVKLFRKCVKEIHNLLHPIEDREITVDELVNSQYNNFIYGVISDVALHILKSARLTKEERKNLSADAKQ